MIRSCALPAKRSSPACSRCSSQPRRTHSRASPSCSANRIRRSSRRPPRRCARCYLAGGAYESGGFVIDQGGVFRPSKPVTQRSRSDVSYCIVLPRGATLAGLYHTHVGHAAFSPRDRRNSARVGVPSFIGTIRGGALLVYDPRLDQVRAIGERPILARQAPASADSPGHVVRPARGRAAEHDGFRSANLERASHMTRGVAERAASARVAGAGERGGDRRAPAGPVRAASAAAPANVVSAGDRGEPRRGARVSGASRPPPVSKTLQGMPRRPRSRRP